MRSAIPLQRDRLIITVDATDEDLLGLEHLIMLEHRLPRVPVLQDVDLVLDHDGLVRLYPGQTGPAILTIVWGVRSVDTTTVALLGGLAGCNQRLDHATLALLILVLLLGG